MTGIYKIQSIIKSQRIYIGSTINIEKRQKEHFNDLKARRHNNIKLQNHYNKYGENDLVFSLLLGCEKEDLIKHEQFFIDVLNPWFNILPAAGSPLGNKHSEETKMKMSDAKKGKKKSQETRDKMSKAQKGRLHGKLKRKRVVSVEGRKLLKLAYQQRKSFPSFKGRHHSAESNKKNSESHKGRIPWNKGRTDIYSEETKRNISESLKKFCATEEGIKQTQRRVEINTGKPTSKELSKRRSEYMWEYHQHMLELRLLTEMIEEMDSKNKVA